MFKLFAAVRNLNFMTSMNGVAAVAPKILNLTPSQLQQQAKITADILRSGEVVATPTDTIYGLAALANTTKAVRKIYDIKGRNQSKPISICVSNVKEVGLWGNVTISETLLEHLLPGPVTLCFKRSENLNPELNPDSPIVGIRIPDHPFIREVCRLTQSPLALTSANISQGKSTLAVEEFSELYDHLSLIVNGGVLGLTEEARLGSTVVDLSCPGTYRIIRSGCAEEDTTFKLHKFGLVKQP